MAFLVAPHVGAWIETTTNIPLTRLALSRPTWARGLKLVLTNAVTRGSVAPHVGAWIETCLFHIVQLSSPVAPHVGAWIETKQMAAVDAKMGSRPTWARGLKHRIAGWH